MSSLEFAASLVAGHDDTVEQVVEHFRYRFGGTYVLNSGYVRHVEQPEFITHDDWSEFYLHYCDGEDIVLEEHGFKAVPDALGFVQGRTTAFYVQQRPRYGYKYGLCLNALSLFSHDTEIPRLLREEQPGGFMLAKKLFLPKYIEAGNAWDGIDGGEYASAALSSEIALVSVPNHKYPALAYGTWKVGYVDDCLTAHISKRVDHLREVICDTGLSVSINDE